MKLEDKESLVIHIEGLQATLTKRNARIKELEEILARPLFLPEKIQKMVDDSYKKGWKDCSHQMIELTRNAALELGKIRKEAYRYYLKGEEDSE